MNISSEKDKLKLMIDIAEVNYATKIGLNLVGNYRGDYYASCGVRNSLYA